MGMYCAYNSNVCESNASVKTGPLQHPTLVGKQGNISQLGGDFILGPGNVCSFAHRMQNTEDRTFLSYLFSIIYSQWWKFRRCWSGWSHAGCWSDLSLNYPCLLALLQVLLTNASNELITFDAITMLSYNGRQNMSRLNQTRDIGTKIQPSLGRLQPTSTTRSCRSAEVRPRNAIFPTCNQLQHSLSINCTERKCPLILNQVLVRLGAGT